jgi:type I restriction enzyme M protein
MRIVAVFDLPANVFAETGVNTTLIVAYKPDKTELVKLQKLNYEILFRDIKKVGYEKRTSGRVKIFEPVFKINYQTFDIEIDSEGRSMLDEEFTITIKEFQDWCNSQEQILKDLFIKDK